MSRSYVAVAIALAGSMAAAGADEAPITLTLQPEDAKDAPLPAGTSWRDGWGGSISLGLNGADGNTENFSIRVAFDAKRETEANVTTFSSIYTRSQSDGEVDGNRWENRLRNDFLVKDSPWRFFAQGEYVYDDFQDWQHQWSLFGGVGRDLIKNDKTSLLGRLGVGVTQQIGGEDEDVHPEGLIGADFEHKFSERSKLYATAEYYPSLDEFPDYRVYGKAGYEVVVDPDIGMSFKVGLEDRYDSTPGDGFKRNDITYFALLAWNF